MTKITEEIKKLLAEEKRMHREAVTYIDKAPKGVLKYQRINDKVYYYSQENSKIYQEKPDGFSTKTCSERLYAKSEKNFIKTNSADTEIYT